MCLGGVGKSEVYKVVTGSNFQLHYGVFPVSHYLHTAIHHGNDHNVIYRRRIDPCYPSYSVIQRTILEIYETNVLEELTPGYNM